MLPDVLYTPTFWTFVVNSKCLCLRTTPAATAIFTGGTILQMPYCDASSAMLAMYLKGSWNSSAVGRKVMASGMSSVHLVEAWGTWFPRFFFENVSLF